MSSIEVSRVLLVDDEESILKTYSDILGCHFEIDTARCGTDALDAIKRKRSGNKNCMSSLVIR